METDRVATKTFHTDLPVQSIHNEIVLLDAYKPAFSSWSLSNDDVYELITIIYDFTDNINRTGAKMSIDYSPVLKDIKIELNCDGKILKSYNKKTQIILPSRAV